MKSGSSSSLHQAAFGVDGMNGTTPVRVGEAYSDW